MKYQNTKGWKYRLMEELSIKLGEKFILFNYMFPIENPYFGLKDSILTIKKQYSWDGPSGPTIDTKNFMKGSLIHDALYQMMRLGYIPESYRKEADKILRYICIEEGMSRFRAWYVYVAVRLFAGKSAKLGSDKPPEIIEI
jgi:hypothetical protein